MITKEDVKDIARSINVELTETELLWIRACYKGEQNNDPTATWDLVVETLIYECIEMRKISHLYEQEIFGEDASTDDCWFDGDDDTIIDMGHQIL